MDINSTLEQMNDRYCVVPYGGKVRVLSFELENERELATYYSATDFRLLYVNKRIPVAGRKEPVQLGDWWLKHPERRQHEGVIFAPGKPALVDGRWLNLWRGWGIEPRAGDWSLLGVSATCRSTETLVGAYSDRLGR